jgi:DNA-binding response OmpR family regulator
MRVLVVEDEARLATQLADALRAAGFAVDTAADGARADFLARTEQYDAAVLDLGLPQIDGLTVLRGWRDSGLPLPVLVLTARGSWHEKVQGIDGGADDYMSKPFGLAELQARVRALLRRTSNHSSSDDGPPGGLRIDVAARRVFSGTDEVPLTGKEFEVLSVLAANRDKVVSRDRLMADVWDENWYGSTKTLDVTIGRLRQKLERADVGERIVAVRGVGFRLESPADV